MSRNGSGGYSLPSNSWNPALNGAPATAADWQALINDVAAAIQQSISADGQTTITGNLQMGGNKLTNLAAGSAAGQSVRFEQLFGQGALIDIASASITDIGAPLTNFLRVTGTTGITSFGTNYNGPKFLIFAGVVTLTNSATLVLPSGGDITTAAGDSMIVIPLSAGWQVVAFQRASGDLFAKSLNGGQLAGLKNMVINGNFQLNERTYVSGVATTIANQYTLDRWRVVTLGQSVTFSASGNGNSITAPAGGVEQVVEGASIVGGSYVLNWTGTATASVNGTTRAKGEVFTLPANTNATIRLIGGSASLVQLEQGTVVTSFEHLPIGIVRQLCQRYFQAINGMNISGYALGGAAIATTVSFKVTMRRVPEVTGISSPSLSNFSSFQTYGVAQDGFGLGIVATSTGMASALSVTASANAEF